MNNSSWVDHVVLVMSLIFCVGAILFLVWLLWEYTPAQTVLFARLGTQLSLPTRITIAASNWFVRLFPSGVILTFAAAAGGVVVLFTWGLSRAGRVRTESACSALFLIIGLAAAMMSGFMIVTMHMPFRQILDALT